jgi:hypothetical protein
MRIKPIFAWYDFWVGAFWDRRNRRIYLFPVPMFRFAISFGEPSHAQRRTSPAASPRGERGPG